MSRPNFNNYYRRDAEFILLTLKLPEEETRALGRLLIDIMVAYARGALVLYNADLRRELNDRAKYRCAIDQEVFEDSVEVFVSRFIVGLDIRNNNANAASPIMINPTELRRRRFIAYA